MMHEVILNRDYYARSSEIVNWLWDHVGNPEWHGAHSQEAIWKTHQVFGYTIIQFKHEADLVQFKLTWC